MMLISQSQSEWNEGNGSPTHLSELRRRLETPSRMDEATRQRLVNLAQRLARVRALGDEFNRVDLSKYALEPLLSGAVA